MKKKSLRIFILFILTISPFLTFSQILINEFSSKGSFLNSNNDECDWIELIIISDSINISEYYISDKISNLKKCSLPNYVLDSGEVFLISLDDDIINSMTIIDSLEYFNAQFKLKKNETIFISDSNDNILDSKLIEIGFFKLSEGRDVNNINNWVVYETPTPGYHNDTSSCIAQLPPPEIATISGLYNSSFYLTVNYDSSTTIRYTTNGDIPSQNSRIFLDSILIDSTSIISLRVFKNGYCSSYTIDRIFFINESKGLKVISLVTDSLNLWDDSLGIYSHGPNADSIWPFLNANFWQDSYKYARIECFSEEYEFIKSGQIDLRINGGASRTYPQKSFKLNFRSKYSGNLNWNFLSNKPDIVSFNNIILRNGGSGTTMGLHNRINDGLMSLISQNSNVDVMGYEPCILYLNGTFWGQYALRENIDEHYIENNYKLNSDSVNIISARKGLINGSNTWLNMAYNTIMNTNPSEVNFSSLVRSKINLDNYFDYFIIQTYIQNGDWYTGRNNLKYWQAQSSKWNYVLYDTDQSYSSKFDSVNSISFSRSPYKLNIDGDTIDYSSKHSRLFNHILNNKSLKCLFINRYIELVNNIFHPSSFKEKLNSIKLKIEHIIPDHFSRWPTDQLKDSQLFQSEQEGKGNFYDYISDSSNDFSYDDWIANLDNYIELNNYRFNSYINDLQNEFNLEAIYLDTANITFDLFPKNQGYISFQSYNEYNFPYIKSFVKTDCPNIITARNVSNDYTFSHWSTKNEILSTNAKLDITNLDVDEIELHFKENQLLLNYYHLVLFPNPIIDNKSLNIEFLQEENIEYEINIYHIQSNRLIKSKKIDIVYENQIRRLNLEINELKKSGIYIFELSSIKGGLRRKFIKIVN